MIESLLIVAGIFIAVVIILPVVIYLSVWAGTRAYHKAQKLTLNQGDSHGDSQGEA